MVDRYRDRREAGQVLADALNSYARRDDVVVLALPRGGVPVAFEVARALDAPLEVFVVRKLGAPAHPELAIGAIASGGVRVLNEDVVHWYSLSPGDVDRVADAEAIELERRERLYRGNRPMLPVAGRVVILVDDGLATGASMRAAVGAARRLGPSRVVVAVPVGAPETCRALAAEADEVVCPRQPERFDAVGLWYVDFSQTSDEEVQSLLAAARAARTTLPQSVRRP